MADLRTMLAGFVDEVAEKHASTTGRIQSLRTLALALRFGDDRSTAALVTLAAHRRMAIAEIAKANAVENSRDEVVASL